MVSSFIAVALCVMVCASTIVMTQARLTTNSDAGGMVKQSTHLQVWEVDINENIYLNAATAPNDDSTTASMPPPPLQKLVPPVVQLSIVGAREEIAMFQVAVRGLPHVPRNISCVSTTSSSSYNCSARWTSFVFIDDEKLVPDPISELTPWYLGENNISTLTLGLWIEISVPSSHCSGSNIAQVRTTLSDGSSILLANLTVGKIFNFTMPSNADAAFTSDGAFTEAIQNWKKGLPSLAGVEHERRVAKEWFGNFQRHRVNSQIWQGIQAYAPKVWYVNETYSVVHDTEEFEMIVAMLKQQGYTRGFRIPMPFGSSDQMYNCAHDCPADGSWLVWTYPPANNTNPRYHPRNYLLEILDTAKYRESNHTIYEANPNTTKVFNSMMGAMVRYLESRNLLDMFHYFFMVDEPNWRSRLTLEIMNIGGSLFKSLHPKIKWWQTGWPMPGPQLETAQFIVPNVDVWVGNPLQVNVPGVKEIYAGFKRQYGCQLFLYDDAVPGLRNFHLANESNRMQQRHLGWQLWQTRWLGYYQDNPREGLAMYKVKGLTGTLNFWTNTLWPGNIPDMAPRDLPGPWIMMHNLPYYTLYPPRDYNFSASGPVDSVRWEMVLMGMQEGEYLVKLQDLLEQTDELHNCSVIFPKLPDLLAIDPLHRIRFSQCCQAALASNTTLNSIHQHIVWNFTSYTRETLAPYTTNGTLVKETKIRIGDNIDDLQRCV